MDTSTQVIIVGGGPTGLFLALRLARSGIKTVVLEQEATFSPTPRALGYFGPSQFALQHAGIWEDVKERGYLLTGLSWRKMTTETSPGHREWGPLIASWDLTKNTPFKEGECGYGMTILGQDRLRQLLLSKLADYSLAQVYLGHTVLDVSQDEASATVTLTSLDPQGQHRQFTGSYLVGADGAKSTVRKSLGLNLEGTTWPQVLIATDTWVDLPMPEDGFPFAYLVDPVDWALFSPIQQPCKNEPSYYRITVPMTAEESEPDVLERSLEEKLEKLVPGSRPLKCHVVRSQKYQIHQRIVPSMISGRCLLVGDAAHLNNVSLLSPCVLSLGT